MEISVNSEIEEMKRLLTGTVANYNFNFQHPNVLIIS
jgi:hypothetical protein